MTKVVGWTLAGWLAAIPVAVRATAAQTGPCTRRSDLPAYSHNDYQNSRPLTSALELGFRGVETDILFRGGELRVGHDVAGTRPGRTLEALYLRPLRTIIHRCGKVIAQPMPFLLNIELKERSRPGYDSLIALLERYADVFEPSVPGVELAPVEIVLVGWHPPSAEPARARGFRVGRQQLITTLSSGTGTYSTAAIRLVSLNYDKTIRWSGQGPPPDRAARWLERLRAAKGESPGRLARAYNVPVNAAVYRLLLEGGVDVIGTKRLSASRRVLLTLGVDSLQRVDSLR